MSEERFREIFRRITSETPDAPDFAVLEVTEARPSTPLTFKPWMAAVGAALLVMVVVGAFGLLGGGGPDLASPSEGLINYVKLNYTATVNPVCEDGQVTDNRGFDEATIEIWGPNVDQQWLMVSTFPDGSTERQIVEGDPNDPGRAWGIDPVKFENETGYRIVQCTGASNESPALLLGPFYAPGFLPMLFIGPPPGGTFSVLLVGWDVEGREYDGREVLEYRRTSAVPTGGDVVSSYYVNSADPALLVGFRIEFDAPSLGTSVAETTSVVRSVVESSTVSFDTDGLFFIAKPGARTAGTEDATIVPDVVGQTVSQATSTLEVLDYIPSFHDSDDPTYEVCAQEPAAGLEIDPGAIIGMRTAAPGGCEDLMNPVLAHALNPDYQTYEDEFGRTWYATACPNADVLVLGGVGAADGLPKKGQTWKERVEAQTAFDTSSLAAGVIEVSAVPRNGEVWDRDGGEVVVEQVADFMVQLTLADDAPCPLAPPVWNGVPVAFIRQFGPGELCPDEPPLGSAQVMVFFDCGSGDEPNPIGFARALHPNAPDRITSVFWHMLAGPSVNERGRGSGSFFNEPWASSIFFSEESADALISTELTGTHLVVDFNESVLVNNASTSTGSLFFLFELTSNAFSVDEVESVEFRINGSCEGFWAFLQAGDDVCNVIDRP